jgi:hypothetical protein
MMPTRRQKQASSRPLASSRMYAHAKDGRELITVHRLLKPNLLEVWSGSHILASVEDTNSEVDIAMPSRNFSSRSDGLSRMETCVFMNLNQVSFKFSCLGGKILYKKQHQAKETETPLMLLFVCNGTDQASITSDAKQMLNTVLDDIKQNGMLPEEFENKVIPHLTLCLNMPRLPAKTKSSNNKGYHHYKEHGKKAFHFKVTKEEVNYFKYLSAHAHRMKLDIKYFGKFAKFTGKLGSNAPLSDCTRLRRCIQGHLNYHLSLTGIMINGIDMLDASEYLRNPANGKSIVQLTLRDLLYRITLENKAPLFLQLSQRPSGEVDAVIPNTAKAELMAEKMNVQIAAWCHFYWNESNPGGKRFYRKLSDRAFSQVLLHEIGDCTWDSSLKAVTSLSAQSEMSAIAEFKQQDWVKLLLQDSGAQQLTKAHIDPNVAFPFQDDFSVGTIRGANAKAATPSTAASPTATEVVEIQDNKDNVSVLPAKTTSKAQSEVTIGSRVASGSNPVSGLTAVSTQPGAASRGLDDPASDGLASGAIGGPMGEWSSQIPLLHPREEGLTMRKADCQVGLQLQFAEGVSNVRRDTQRKEAASRHHQLLSTCMKLKNLCINGKLKTTSHLSMMEKLRIKAD